jgi:excisionase family DNA binding protein
MAEHLNRSTDRVNKVPRQLVSLKEAADYLGVSTRTIRTYIARGILRAHRIQGSRLIRIDVADLDALVRPLVAGWDAS